MPDNGALERLEKKLDQGDSRNVRRAMMPERSAEAPRGWGASPQPARPRRRFGMVELVFGASIIFFIVAAGVAGLLFLSGGNTVSTKNVDVVLAGPSEIGAGETLSLQIVIVNRNTVPMELSDLVIEFPPGTRSSSDVSIELPRIRESIGTIEPGASVNRSVKAVIFGEEGASVVVNASIEYRIPASNAIFVSRGSYAGTVSQAPASIIVDALTEAVSGQEVSITATVVSNAPGPLSDMLLVAEYPPGFTFSSSAPAPAAGTRAWAFGDIEPGGRRSVTIRGTFTGEEGDARVIHFTTGTRKANREGEITVPLATNALAVGVTKPFISVVLALDGDVAAEHTVSRGKTVRGDIRWVNNLPINVQDVEIELKIQGAVLDRTKVTTEHGFFRSSDQTLTWSKQTDNDLGNVPSGDSGVQSFSFATLASGSFKNPELTFTVNVRARRVTEENVPENIVSSASSRVVVATDLALSAFLSHGGIFTDKGPVPPKADTETEYTVTWTATNSSNAVANASVSAVLPSYVRWTGRTSPADGSVAYNPVGGIVTWTIGDLAEGGAKSAAFQVAITPSVSQVGDEPTIVGDQRIYGFDRFARLQIERVIAPLTTASASSGSGRVVP